MKSVISQFLEKNDLGDVVLNKAAFSKFADEEYAKSLSRTSADKQAAHEKLMKAVASPINGNTAGVAMLNAIEGEYHVLNVYRDNPVLDFVEVRDLPLGSVPIFRTRYENPVGIQFGGLAGTGFTEYYATNDAVTQVGTFTLKTNEVMVPNLNNIYDMVKLEQRKAALTREDEYMKIAITNAALNTLLGGTDVSADPAVTLASYYTAANTTWSTGLTYTAGAGYFNGKTPYILDPGVLQAGIPTTNCFNLVSEGGLTRQVFQAINSWRLQMNRNVRKIYVSNVGAPWEAMQNQATPVGLVTGAGINNTPSRAIPKEMWAEYQKKDYKGIVVEDWFGMGITVERQNWIPQGYAIVLTDNPAVLMWDRLSLSSGNQIDGSIETPVDAFYSRHSQSRNIAMIQPQYCLTNFMVLKLQ